MKLYLKLNANLHGYKAGTVIRISACAAGIPLNKKWRNSLRDSKVDNCLKILSNPSTVIKNKAITG